MNNDDYAFAERTDPEFSADSEDGDRMRAEADEDGWSLRDAVTAYWAAMPTEQPEPEDDGTENPFSEIDDVPDSYEGLVSFNSMGKHNHGGPLPPGWKSYSPPADAYLHPDSVAVPLCALDAAGCVERARQRRAEMDEAAAVLLRGARTC